MIYLDHAAATPVSKKALEVMEPYWRTEFFNPSAAYLPAKAVAEAYEKAKAAIAHAIGAKGSDLVITGSATEANNLAFTAVSGDGEVLALATEHASVLEVARRSGRRATFFRGHAQERSPKLTVREQCCKFSSNSEIAVDALGRIDLEDLQRKITDKTERSRRPGTQNSPGAPGARR